jgi:hypothetical protein
MSGSAELREQAAEGLGELIDVTSENALKPFVVPITGYIPYTLLFEIYYCIFIFYSTSQASKEINSSFCV